jgi:hypothetical protein
MSCNEPTVEWYKHKYTNIMHSIIMFNHIEDHLTDLLVSLG